MPESKPKIVLVDDDAGMNQAVERLLLAAGFRAETFASGEALLDSHAADTADCLILDVHLPGISGLDLCRKLHQSGSTRPVIFITALDDPLFPEKAREAGASASFRKPFSGKNLLGAIHEALHLTESCAASSPAPELKLPQE